MLQPLCYCCALLVAYVLVVEAKIVYLNGTLIPRDSLKTIMATTSSPSQSWFSVFEPRNISNHSGSKGTLGIDRQEDAEDQEQMMNGDDDVVSNGTMATRTGRKLRLFYMQRFLNGLHMIALLVGIYLMIFVVEPVAVPNHFLAQHYYGLPWSHDVHRASHREHFGSLQLKRRHSLLQDSLDKLQKLPNVALNRPQPAAFLQQNFKSQLVGQLSKPPPVHHHKSSNVLQNNKSSPIYRPKANHGSSRNVTSRVKYISLEELQRRRNNTLVGKIHHWSKWVPQRNSSSEGQFRHSNPSEWTPSLKSIQKINVGDGKTKVHSSYGKAESIPLLEILQ